MKILFLSSGATVPSSRFRIQAYLSRFQADGHQVVMANSFPQKYDYFPWMGFRPSQLLKRSVRWWHWVRACLSSYDVVFIDREIFDDATTEMEERFRKCCRRLVLDIDDAVFLRQPDKFVRLFKLADLVVCGNPFLVDEVAPLTQRTLHVPTSVDMDDYVMRPDTNNSPPVVGWIGTTGNLKYIEVAAEALRTVATEIDFEFRLVVPDTSPLQSINLEGVRIVQQPWKPQTQVQRIQQFDVGIMPLFPNEPWDKFKCGAKLIQYLAVGVPGIASPVGVNSTILNGGQNGIPAQTTEEWVSGLRRLLKNPSLRRDMGVRGRQTIEERFSIQANYSVLRDGLLDLENL